MRRQRRARESSMMRSLPLRDDLPSMECPRKLLHVAVLLGQVAFAIFRKLGIRSNTLPEVMQVPVDLHDQLSEFSYGYGVTREVERQLASVGLRPTPFLPSLLHEAVLGFDVKFDRPGAALLLQFKLGEALQRFRRDDTSKPPPPIRAHSEIPRHTRPSA
jgi:hypothetical protein